MRKLIACHPLARYAKIAKPAWWMKSRDCGPIVEQATHFIDLSRYFGGDVVMDSVQAHALGQWRAIQHVG